VRRVDAARMQLGLFVPDWLQCWYHVSTCPPHAVVKKGLSRPQQIAADDSLGVLSVAGSDQMKGSSMDDL